MTVARAGLPARDAARPGCSQPWSTALVTRCRRASATPSSTRASSSTSSPSSTSSTSLPVGRGHLADELGEAGHDPAHRHHRQPHRAVADARPAGRGRPRCRAASSRARGGQLVAERDRARARRRRRRGGQLDVGRSWRRSARTAASELLGGQRRPARRRARSMRRSVELRLADDVEQVVDPAGRDADRVAARGRPASTLGRRRVGQRRGAPQPRHRRRGRPRRARGRARPRRSRARRRRPGWSAPGIEREMPSAATSSRSTRSRRTPNRPSRSAPSRSSARCATLDDAVERRASGPSP